MMGEAVTSHTADTDHGRPPIQYHSAPL